MAARVVEVCDAALAVIRAAWDPVAPDEVARRYDLEIITLPEEAQRIKGRKVYGLPDAYTSPEAATRGEDVNEYGLFLLVAERYEAAGPVPNAWVDERIAFVEQTVLGPLGDARTVRLLADPADPENTGLYPYSGFVETVFDAEELTHRKLFLSVVRLTFRESVEV